jgi:hypothetical protein
VGGDSKRRRAKFSENFRFLTISGRKLPGAFPIITKKHKQKPHQSGKIQDFRGLGRFDSGAEKEYNAGKARHCT